MGNSSQLFWGMIFGAIGLGYFTYGKKQSAVVPLVIGIALFIFPYFFSSTAMLVITGSVLVAIPYFVRL